MGASIAQFLKRLVREKSGNAILMTALGMPVLIGAAGYALDMAQLYAWKRELQHSVDQAALAGAWSLAYDPSSTDYSTRALQEYDSNQILMASYATRPSIQRGNYGGGVNNSLIVSARVTKQLPFSSFIVQKAMTVAATAQATFAQGGTYKACLMTLKEGEAGTFVVGGTASVNATCGLGALSCEEGAIDIGTNTTVITDTIVTCGTATVPESLQSKVTDGATSISNPFEGLPAPTPTSETAKTFKCPKSGTYNITPGRYTGGMNMTCKVVMAKGIYVVDGGVLDLTSNKGDVTGTGVMFVLRNGAALKIGGSGNGGLVNLTPLEAGDFVGTANEAYKNLYAGMLVYEDNTGVTSPVAHTFNGNADVSVRGTFYLPNGDLTVNGTGNTAPLCFQLWASTLKINGTASITTTCTSTQTNSAGSSAGGVRLVA